MNLFKSPLRLLKSLADDCYKYTFVYGGSLLLFLAVALANKKESQSFIEAFTSTGYAWIPFSVIFFPMAVLSLHRFFTNTKASK